MRPRPPANADGPTKSARKALSNPESPFSTKASRTPNSGSVPGSSNMGPSPGASMSKSIASTRNPRDARATAATAKPVERPTPPFKLANTNRRGWADMGAGARSQSAPTIRRSSNRVRDAPINTGRAVASQRTVDAPKSLQFATTRSKRA